MNARIRKVVPYVVGGLGVAATGAAHAVALTFDSTDAVGSIDAGGAVVAALGGSALLITIGIKMWKRFRGAA